MAKNLKRVLVILCMAAIMLANIVPCFAMGFDAEVANNSIFVIYSGNSLGSGFAIGENCIITNAHVISNKNDVSISTYDGKEYSAYVVSMDETLDIAVLSVSGASFTPLETCTTVTLGEDVYAIGAPESMDYTLTKGIISAKEREVDSQTYIQTDAAINSGNSGGPLLNDQGQVIGVNSYKLTNTEGIGLAIPITTVISYLNGESIETDDNGNVVGNVGSETETEKSSPEKKTTEQLPTQSNNKIKIIVGIVVLVVVIILILFFIIRTKKKRKSENILAVVGPSDRTDFEIDILE